MNENLKGRKYLVLKRIPAKITEPAVGASWASGNKYEPASLEP
jgi:hypothetical protein